jgi:hypothetical protein
MLDETVTWLGTPGEESCGVHTAREQDQVGTAWKAWNAVEPFDTLAWLVLF